MAAKRFYWLSYHAARERDRDLSLHLVRDGAAFAELSSVLSSFKYNYAGVLFNPPHQQSGPLQQVRGRHKSWYFLNPDDILLLPTRPPLDDRRQGSKKQITRSCTWLECQVFLAIDAFFEICSRTNVRLSESLRIACMPGYENRFDIKYFQCPWAWYQELKSSQQLRYERVPVTYPRRTAGYILCTRIRTEEWPTGPRLLAVFGMGGMATFVLAYLLHSKKHASRLLRALLAADRPRLMMVELTAPGEPPQVVPSAPPDSMDRLVFADQWDLKPILDATL